MENLNAEQTKCIKLLEFCDNVYSTAKLTPEEAKVLLSLITSQEQRIKELTEENERFRAENVDCQLGFRLLEDAFERLEKINEQTEAETRAETVGQMQERLKERFSTATRYSKYSGAGVVMVIDQIAKEMADE